ncbi:hypothetical protein HanOQP8_Chr16g0639991 [Helianthus annuus]|nr:hypothetical protein HanLR1_Chr16g0644651 [Helianthus annuus]KAJ0646873.1 hypothetical protein HanOQP8_Chr16g0639991 [Helianthus annuus]
MGEITTRFPCTKKLSSSTRLIIRDSTILFISFVIKFEILILFLPGGVSDRMGRDFTAADVSIVVADIIFSGLEEASLSEHGSSIAPKTLRQSKNLETYPKGHNARKYVHYFQFCFYRI